MVLCSHLLRDVEETCEEVLILKRAASCITRISKRNAGPTAALSRWRPLATTALRRSACEKLGCECAMSGGKRIKAVLSEGIEIRDIYRLAAERDMQLRRLNYRRDTLEDIFLKAMETETTHGRL